MIRFGIIGSGTIAAWHAEGIRSCKDAVLTGVTDVRPEAAKAFCARHGGRPYETLDALLDDPSIDAVCICTPSGLHARQAIQAAQKGKHALIEKPLALTVQEADQVLAAAAQHRVTLGVVSQYRFLDSFQALHQAVRAGWLGRVVTAEVLMKYHRSAEYYAQSNWRGTWAMDGGGALMNQGIHGIDTLMHLMGPVRHVYGLARTLSHAIEVEDTAAAVLEFQSGALGIIQGTTSVYPGYPRRLSISGTRGTITVVEQLVTEWDVLEVPLPEGIVLGGRQRSGASEPTNLESDSHAMHIRDLVEAIEQGRDPAVPVREAREVIALITAVYRSSETGKRIDLNDFR